MKIVYVVETYTEGLGYIDNLLPREFSNLGHEVHVLTCGLPPYYMTNEAFFGDLAKDETGEESIKEVDGVELHKHRYGLIGGRLFMKGLIKKLLKISPDVVLVRGISSFVLGQVVYAKCFSKFKLFTSSGQAYSNIPLSLRDSKAWLIDRIKNTITRVIPGRLLSFFVQGCIGSTVDCVDCVVDYCGVPRKKHTKYHWGLILLYFSQF